MSLCRRSDGRWAVKWKDSVTGKWRQSAFRSRQAALEFEESQHYDRRENERMTLGDAVAAFIASVPHCHANVVDYSFLINGRDRRDGTHSEGPAEFLADKYCDELTRRDLENLRLRLRERGQCARSINQNVARLKAAMNWAAEQEMIQENPWAKFRGLPTGRRGTRAGTLEDFLRVYEILPEWLRWACRTALALCLRPGMAELFRLTWDRFDWRGRRVVVPMPKVGREKVVYPPEWYLAEAWERFREDSAAGQTLVCRNRSGRPVRSGSGYRMAWTAHCRRAGVRMPFYAIRHIAASEMLAAGADLAAVSAQLGHSTPAVTAAFYAHAVDRAQRMAGEALPRPPAGLGAAAPRRRG